MHIGCFLRYIFYFVYLIFVCRWKYCDWYKRNIITIDKKFVSKWKLHLRKCKRIIQIPRKHILGTLTSMRSSPTLLLKVIWWWWKKIIRQPTTCLCWDTTSVQTTTNKFQPSSMTPPLRNGNIWFVRSGKTRKQAHLKILENKSLKSHGGMTRCR